ELHVRGAEALRIPRAGVAAIDADALEIRKPSGHDGRGIGFGGQERAEDLHRRLLVAVEAPWRCLGRFISALMPWRNIFSSCHSRCSPGPPRVASGGALITDSA